MNKNSRRRATTELDLDEIERILELASRNSSPRKRQKSIRRLHSSSLTEDEKSTNGRQRHSSLSLIDPREENVTTVEHAENYTEDRHIHGRRSANPIEDLAQNPLPDVKFEASLNTRYSRLSNAHSLAGFPSVSLIKVKERFNDNDEDDTDSEENERGAAEEKLAALNRPQCLETIYKNSCRSQLNREMIGDLLISPPPTGSCPVPRGFAMEKEDAVVKQTCYGLLGETVPEQVKQMEEDTKIPVPASSLPYGGNVIHTGPCNPLCLQMAIMVVPICFFIIMFGVQYGTLTSTPSKAATEVSQLLSQLSTALVMEQGTASYVSSFSTRLDNDINIQEFYDERNTELQKFAAVQEVVNQYFSLVEVKIGLNEKELRELLGGLSVLNLLKIFQLSLARVRTVRSLNFSDISMRYNAVVQNIIIFRGILILRDALKTTSIIIDMSSLFSTVTLYLIKSLSLYLTDLGLGPNLPSPKDAAEVLYLEATLGYYRVLQRTFLFPLAPSLLYQIISTANDDNTPLLGAFLPDSIARAVTDLLVNTFKDQGTDVLDLSKAVEMLDSVSQLAKEVASDAEENVSLLRSYAWKSQIILAVCLYICFGFAVVGAIGYALVVPIFRADKPKWEKVNTVAKEMWACTIRMHEGVMKMIHLNTAELIKRSEKLSKTSLQFDEEKLYAGFRMVHRLEPFLPLPMVHPPAGVSDEYLLHSTLFVRPSLLARKSLVGLRIHFSPSRSDGKGYDMRSSIAEPLCTFASDTFLHHQKSFISGLEYSQNTVEPATKIGKRWTLSEQKEERYFDRAKQILTFLGKAANLLLSTEDGGYLACCGEDVVLWVNICEEVSQPCLIAYLIAQSVMEYCEQMLLECPQMCLCRASGILGNLSSFDVSSSTDGKMQEGMWTRSILFDSDNDSDAGSGEEEEDVGMRDSSVNTGWKDFISATEGVPVKHRLKRWFKQLLGMELDRGDVKHHLRGAGLEKDTSVLGTVQKEDKSDDDENWEENNVTEASMAFEERYPKGDCKPLPDSNCLTSFVVYGEVVQEMIVAMEVGCCHSQILVANEPFVQALHDERCEVGVVLKKLEDIILKRREKSDCESMRNSVFSRSQLGIAGSFSYVDGKKGAKGGQSTQHFRGGKASPQDIMVSVTRRVAEEKDIISLLELLEVRCRSFYIGPPCKISKRGRIREKDCEGGNVDIKMLVPFVASAHFGFSDMLNAGDTVVRSTNFAEMFDKQRSEWRRNGGVIEIGVKEDASSDGFVRKCAVCGFIRAFYCIALQKDVRNDHEESSFSVRDSYGSRLKSVNRKSDAVIREGKEWECVMKCYLKVCYSFYAYLQQLGGRDVGKDLSLSKSEIVQFVSETKAALLSFCLSSKNSKFVLFSAPRLMSVLRSSEVVLDSSPSLPVPLLCVLPFSLGGLQLYLLHPFVQPKA